jgi:hypothetical protein
LVLCSRNARPEKGLVRRPHVDQHECPSRKEMQASSKGTGEGRLDGLLCSRNARSRTPLVGRAQWKINQPPSPERKQASLDVTREGSLAVLLLAERARSECARSTRAIEDRPAHPLKMKLKIERPRSGRPPSPPSRAKVDRRAMIFRRENTPDPFSVPPMRAVKGSLGHSL